MRARVTVIEVGVYEGNEEHDPIGYGLDEGDAYALVVGDTEQVRALAALLLDEVVLTTADEGGG